MRNQRTAYRCHQQAPAGTWQAVGDGGQEAEDAQALAAHLQSVALAHVPHGHQGFLGRKVDQLHGGGRAQHLRQRHGSQPLRAVHQPDHRIGGHAHEQHEGPADTREQRHRV